MSSRPCRRAAPLASPLPFSGAFQLRGPVVGADFQSTHPPCTLAPGKRELGLKSRAPGGVHVASFVEGCEARREAAGTVRSTLQTCCGIAAVEKRWPRLSCTRNPGRLCLPFGASGSSEVRPQGPQTHKPAVICSPAGSLQLREEGCGAGRTGSVWTGRNQQNSVSETMAAGDTACGWTGNYFLGLEDGVWAKRRERGRWAGGSSTATTPGNNVTHCAQCIPFNISFNRRLHKEGALIAQVGSERLSDLPQFGRVPNSAGTDTKCHSTALPLAVFSVKQERRRGHRPRVFLLSSCSMSHEESHLAVIMQMSTRASPLMRTSCSPAWTRKTADFWTLPAQGACHKAPPGEERKLTQRSGEDLATNIDHLALSVGQNLASGLQPRCCRLELGHPRTWLGLKDVLLSSLMGSLAGSAADNMGNARGREIDRQIDRQSLPPSASPLCQHTQDSSREHAAGLALVVHVVRERQLENRHWMLATGSFLKNSWVPVLHVEMENEAAPHGSWFSRLRLHLGTEQGWKGLYSGPVKMDRRGTTRQWAQQTWPLLANADTHVQRGLHELPSSCHHGHEVSGNGPDFCLVHEGTGTQRVAVISVKGSSWASIKPRAVTPIAEWMKTCQRKPGHVQGHETHPGWDVSWVPPDLLSWLDSQLSTCGHPRAQQDQGWKLSPLTWPCSILSDTILGTEDTVVRTRPLPLPLSFLRSPSVCVQELQALSPAVEEAASSPSPLQRRGCAEQFPRLEDSTVHSQDPAQAC
ncbi:hypothetical protein Cadr_000027158 [Camelus dromedarius]|uniref:Uncharacterized protein n=1 Tax=Camelus dromedarius TaxID=9838 RepID=A0A5N4C5C8_CAMDR|nr:hypothetical protein Cadr_000027158 [Camelus dromedarius]